MSRKTPHKVSEADDRHIDEVVGRPIPTPDQPFPHDVDDGALPREALVPDETKR